MIMIMTIGWGLQVTAIRPTMPDHKKIQYTKKIDNEAVQKLNTR